MGIPAQQITAPERYQLQRDGSNLGQYLWEIRERDLTAFEGILEALRFVLPFAADIQPRITQEIERLVHLQMTEEDFKVPGWLLSTGTRESWPSLPRYGTQILPPFWSLKKSRTAWTLAPCIY